MATFRIASAPINWGVTGLNPVNPPPDALLDAVVEDGYQGCELGALGYLASSPDDVTREFGARGLDLVTAFIATDLATPLTAAFLAEIEGVAELLGASDAGVLLLSDDMSPDRVAVAGRSDRRPETWWSDDDWQQAQQNVALLSRRAATHGLALAFHPHTGTHIENGGEIERLFDSFGDDAPRLCLDTGHILIGGANPVDVLNRYGSRLAHVHAKDIDGAILDRMRAGELTYDAAVDAGLYCDLGDGLVEWDGITQGIAAADYAGWIVSEQDRTLTSDISVPRVSHRRNREFLRHRFGT